MSLPPLPPAAPPCPPPPPSSRGALLHALLSPELHISLTPSLLLCCDNDELYHLLPLALAAVQRVGETPARRREFSDLTKAFRTRVASCRAVKLRLLLLAETPGFKGFWNVRVKARESVYPAARAALMAETANVLEKGGESGSANGSGASGASMSVSGDGGEKAVSQSFLRSGSGVSSVAGAWHTDKKALYRYAVDELFHETRGVPMADHKRKLRVMHRSFKASELVDTIMERVNFASRDEAVAVGMQLQEAGLISKIGRPARFQDNDKLYKSVILNHSDDGRHACITDTKGRTLSCWEEAKHSTDTDPYQMAQLQVSCDMVDLQSLDFWAKSVFLKEPEKGHVFGYRQIAHPLVCASFANAAAVTPPVPQSAAVDEAMSNVTLSEDNLSDAASSSEGVSFLNADVDVGGRVGVVSSVKVVKVFSSIARPMIVQLRNPIEGADTESDEDHPSVDPLILIKEGDNLGQDMSVELLFRCFNELWSNDRALFPSNGGGVPPFALPYEVFPTSAKQGFMEAVPSLTSLKEFDWGNWIKTRGSDPAGVQRMVASAAGSYIGAYILGAADRHTENVQVQDNLTMLHIDFGFLLGSAPPIDGPQIAIYPQMENAFRAVNAWDHFLDCCTLAFISVRRAAPAIIRTAVMIFEKFGFTPSLVRAYLSGPLSLNTHEKDEAVAAAVVRNLVKHSSQDWKTKFKAYSHDKIDPAFYSALQAKFGPAVLAMKIVDAKNQAASKKLEEEAASAVTKKSSIPDGSKANID